MNNREMLELAAKAAGNQIVGWNEQHGVDVAVMKDGSFWQPLLENPITDCMDDALRLAVKLGMEISVCDKTKTTWAMPIYGDGGGSVQDHAGDERSATRRAIVCAAAEVGRAME